MKFLYHSNCTDGSGAALAAWLKHGDKDNEYIPVQYGSPPPDCLKNEYVYILDFSYKRDVLIEIGKIAKHVTVIDHHKTAMEDLAEPIHNVTTLFDMERSGAALAWEFFQGTPELPLLIQHIQDRDLWKFENTRTKSVITGLRLLKDWKTWVVYLDDPSDLCNNGAAINLFLEREADKIIEAAPPKVWWVTRDTVPVYNLPGFMISDTLHRALGKYPECPYAVGFITLEDKTVYSLRSRKGSNVDVSEIAREYGGGGHFNAAGFSLQNEIYYS